LALEGDARHLNLLDEHLSSGSFDVLLTSPPYWKRRDYGHPSQLGQEETPAQFVKVLTKTVHSWIKLLAPHGSVFINIADTYENGFLANIPTLFEQAMLKKGWRLAHRIIWSKTTSVPQPLASRLASRHEVILHFVPPQQKSYYFDRFALSHNAPTAEIGDVWHLAPSRSSSGHPAPFPVELARRVLLLACPEFVCTECGKAFIRQVEASPILDMSRPQAVRAMAKFEEAGLTEDHIDAIRAVGISDAGMGKRLQKGAGRNTPRKILLAEEAKKALGGYFREFTFAPKMHVGWTQCKCSAPTRPGRVLDPFAGSNTTLLTAYANGFDAVGVDLTPGHI
jgi:DNA modification methylase